MQHRTGLRISTGLLLTLALVVVLAGVSSGGDDPQTFDDEICSNTSAEQVIVQVLNNDTPNNWIADTVRIIDPGDLSTQLLEYSEPDQGTWQVSGNGSITFTACNQIDVDAGRCTEVLGGNPFPIEYIAQDTAGGLSNPSQISITYGNCTLAVTVAYVHSTVRGDGQMAFTWATVAEYDNAGFNLLTEGENGLAPINESLIPSHVVNSDFPQLYEYEAQMDATEFYIQEVALSGARNNYGPYAIGVTFGELPPELADRNDVAEKQIYLPVIVSGP